MRKCVILKIYVICMKGKDFKDWKMIYQLTKPFPPHPNFYSQIFFPNSHPFCNQYKKICFENYYHFFLCPFFYISNISPLYNVQSRTPLFPKFWATFSFHPSFPFSKKILVLCVCIYRIIPEIILSVFWFIMLNQSTQILLVHPKCEIILVLSNQLLFQLIDINSCCAWSLCFISCIVFFTSIHCILFLFFVLLSL